MASLSCFKAYDIRGKVPDDLSPELAFRIGRAVRPQLWLSSGGR